MTSAEAARACAAAREREELPGLAVAAATRDGVVFAGGWGGADLENQVAVGADSVFEIASVTELFTAEAILPLGQDGTLARGAVAAPSIHTAATAASR